MSEVLPFSALLQAGLEHGGFETDDALRVWLPLCRQTLATHDAGKVAPLRGVAALVTIEAGTLGFDPTRAEPPRSHRAEVERVQRPAVSGALQVAGRSRVTTDVDAGSVARINLDVAEPEAEITRPVYLTGYVAWEHRLEHHDPLTDIFSLGMLLASVAIGLDFNDPEDLASFASHRRNLFALHARLHPVVAAAIVEMTELDRHRRAPDLPSLVRRLETYRDQPVQTRLPQLAEGAGAANRRTAVQTHLRDRLFEISRRNRLVYFKGSQGTLNLTVASVPLVMDLRSVRLEQLFVWHPALAAEIAGGKPMTLGKYLRFEDQPYLPSALDKMIAEARRDRAEYGFAQLRLVLCFLHWHNLKEAPEERIVSPLLLLPVELTRKKGVRDQYVLEPTASEVEINPVLRHHLRQLYNLALPESIDLRETTLEAFHEQLSAQIRASEPGVTLRKVDRPQIELIHERARQRTDQFRRRQKLRRPVRTAESFDYSYARENPRPLGLQIFQRKVRPAPLPLRETAGAPPRPRLPHFNAEPAAAESGGVSETERQAFSLRGESTGNRYTWDFDLCSITLGNFNYRKMTLVRDYAHLIDSDLASQAFDDVFSLAPRTLEDEATPTLPLRERSLVVPSDATQVSAIAKARTGRSYIIQGPPGTGKSQTITNLIADYVARGKRVLFVCEKRAAIDVVFHRLKQQGLDELCCLIHDSQTDKKAFVQNLRQTYETWLAEPDGSESARAARDGTVAGIEKEIAALQRFSDAMETTPPATGVSIRRLFERLIELRPHDPALDARTAETLPDYAAWLQWGEVVRRLAATLVELGHVPVFAQHPFRWLAEATIRADRPLEMLDRSIERAEGLLDELETALIASGLPAEHWDTLGEVNALVGFARHAAGLAARGQLPLLDPQGGLAREFEEKARQVRERGRMLTGAREKNQGWREPLAAGDLEAALSQVQSIESSLLRWINPAWYRLKKTLDRAYDFSRHAIRPTYSQVLESLAAERQAEGAVQAAREELRARFGVDDAEVFADELTGLQRPAHPAVQSLRDLVLRSPGTAEVITRLAQLAPRFDELQGTLSTLLHRHEQHGFPALGEALRDLRESSEELPDLLPALAELADGPPAVLEVVRTLVLSPDQLEAATARRSLDEFFRAERWLARCDGRMVDRQMQEAARLQSAMLDQNAALVRAEVRRRFRENVNLSSLPSVGLTAEQKLLKKNYSAGRRILEHEFGKSMRYKSIRDTAAEESGQVVRDLKPIWLMSPLSVSDTLPMQPDLFDVVIFDEASQVPVEEAVPALYRAPQVIVVGDEMQLPPTNFFGGGGGHDADGNELLFEEEGERVSIALDADSFLNQSGKNLPSTLLAWHYRSRSEALISFSNAAFYAGNLFTVPDRQLPRPTQAELLVTTPEAAAANTEALLSRAVSFHRLEHGVYQNQRNPAEAAYIAQLVRELLGRNTGKSLGIVAFSQAQQDEIETALEALGSTDADFASGLEAEQTREEDEQFCGLFVKNLENVQGDERDIILLSICYAPGPDGRMLMNFGPINQRGGEKRLNVIFSRAKHHMAVVSSIRYQAITNDFNDGANALKNFLRYAESSSAGDLPSARAVLESLNPLGRKALVSSTASDAVIEGLAAALRARGYEITTQVGQSRFRCDLALRRTGEEQYAVGLFVDSATHYGNADLLERYVTQPSIMSAFGWKVMLVLARDWYFESEAVLDRIERLLKVDPHSSGVATESENPVTTGSEFQRAAEPGHIAPVGDTVLEKDVIASLPPDAGAPVDAAPSVRRLEFTEGSSRKFWEITCRGSKLTTRFGRIGSPGQTHSKQLPDTESAVKEARRLAAEKLRKGYQEITAPEV